jgi:cation:H+ antiporter
VPLALLSLSLVVLVISAGRLVTAGSRIGLLLRISPVLVGAVVVGFGTSLPETVVSALAVLRDEGDVALGNVAGSNVANLLLVLGAAALVAPVPVPQTALRRELPLSLAAVMAFAAAMQRPTLAVAGALTVATVAAVWLLIAGGQEGASELDTPSGRGRVSAGREIAVALTALALLVLSSHVALESALRLAAQLGLSSGVVGLLILAVGTSLPELAASLQAARAGAHGLLVGTLLGSNLMNSLLIGAVITWLGAPRGVVGSEVFLTRALPIMVVSVAVASALLLRGRVSRAAGAALLGGYAVAAALMYTVTGPAATEHEAGGNPSSAVESTAAASPASGSPA